RYFRVPAHFRGEYSCNNIAPYITGYTWNSINRRLGVNGKSGTAALPEREKVERRDVRRLSNGAWVHSPENMGHCCIACYSGRIYLTCFNAMPFQKGGDDCVDIVVHRVSTSTETSPFGCMDDPCDYIIAE